MTPEQRIQEAHGLWELAIARLAAFAECGAKPARIAHASQAERDAFANWQRVSKECGA
jgi:hypothetical protein